MDQQSGHLKKLDRGAIIDLEFVRSLSTTSGEKYLQDWVLSALPTQEVGKTLKESLETLDDIMKAELFKFTSQGCQERLGTARRWLVCLSEGTAPVLPNNAHTWLQDVWTRLPYYARHRTQKRASGSKDESGDGGPTTQWLTGVAALEALWPSLQKRPVAEIGLDDLDLFVALRWLLKKPMQAEVDKMKMEVLKHHRAAGKQRGAARVSVLEADASNPCKKRRLGAAKAAAKAASDSLFS